MPIDTRDDPAFMERHFTLAELASSWGLHPETLRRLFEFEKDVIRIEHKLRRGKRQYVSLRIPESTARRVYKRYTGG